MYGYEELASYTSGDIRSNDGLLGLFFYEAKHTDKVILAHETRIKELEAENERLKCELKETHKTEVKELLCLISDKEKRFNRAFESEEKEIRRQKYKRCLAMAEWCDAEADVADADGDYDDMQWYQKWHTRYLEYAEIFKPNKTTAQ